MRAIQLVRLASVARRHLSGPFAGPELCAPNIVGRPHTLRGMAQRARPANRHGAADEANGRPAAESHQATKQAAGVREDRARLRERLEARARECGYKDLEQLICKTAAWPAADVAALVGDKTVRFTRHWRAVFGVQGARRGGHARAALEARARECGYEGLEQLIRKTAAWPIAEVTTLTGKAKTWVEHWRATFGVTGTQRATQAERRTRMQTAGLEVLAAGDQPVRADGKLRCRVCGAWRDMLDQHVLRAHRLTVIEYRARFGLASTVLLSNETVWQGRDTDGWWHRYDRKAQAHGYADAEETLARCTDEQAATILGVTARTIKARRAVLARRASAGVPNDARHGR
jgi:hypothetical protein